ncbi:MAG TPA: DUF932 domain-containing protein [Holophagaceae bacterium]|nr:DUF932 domain-containing protein [Holophagaceae bacterium]
MHQGNTLQTIIKTILDNKEQKRDFIVPTSVLEMDEKQNLTWKAEGDSNTFEMSELAHDQLGNFLQIPAKFYDRLRGSAPDLITVNVNRLLKLQENQRRMVRTLPGQARAFLSDRYRRIDHEELAAEILPMIRDRGFTVESADITDTRLYLQVVSPTLEGEIRVGDTVRGGFIISNSEVGQGSLNLQPMLYRLRCTNGMIVRELAKRRAHLGGKQDFLDVDFEVVTDETKKAQDTALWLTMRDAVDHLTSPAGFAQVVDFVKETAGDKVHREPDLVVEELAKKNGLREDEQRSVLMNFLGEQDFTRWGLANAVTAVANSTGSYDRAVELETMGGDIMGLDRRSWELLTGHRA